MSEGAWQKFVVIRCARSGRLDADAASRVLRGIEELMYAGQLTDAALAEVLAEAGVDESSASAIAPSIRETILDDLHHRSAGTGLASISD